MQRNSGARFIPLLITLVIVIITVVAVVSIGRALFFGGDDEQASSEMTTTGRDSLLNTGDNRSVRLTVRGPIVAEENFTSYTITASPANREMVVYNGYIEEVKDQKSYRNNTEAYEQFVFALDKANMMKGAAGAEADEDLRGICATGYVYEYAVLRDDQTVQRLWTSTCKGSEGTLDASVEQLNSLYQKQIPVYDDLTPFKTSPFQGLRF